MWVASKSELDEDDSVDAQRGNDAKKRGDICLPHRRHHDFELALIKSESEKGVEKVGMEMGRVDPLGS